MLQWNDNNSVKYLLNFGNFNKVACFDIDHTIIKPKNNRKFPRGKDDWVFYYDNIIVEKLKDRLLYMNKSMEHVLKNI